MPTETTSHHDPGADHDAPATGTLAGLMPQVGTSRGDGTPLSRALWRLILPGVVVGLVLALLAGELSNLMVGVLAIGLMMALMLVKVPIGLAMCAPALLGIYALAGTRGAFGAMRSMPYTSVATWSLTVLPMFIFMGLLLWRSGVSELIYIAARQWLGWVPAGLAVGTNFAGAGLAAVSGSTIGTTYALARVGIPEMLRAGYDRRLVIGSVLMAGTGGQLIPPSILLVVYAGIAEVGVGRQLLAGLLPGVLLAVLYGLTMLILGTIRGGVLAGSGRSRIEATWSDRIRSLGAIWTVPALTVLVIGGMFGGFMTATEAGAAGAAGAVLITLWSKRGERPWSAIATAAASTARTVAAIFFLVIGAQLLSRLLAISGLAREVASFVIELGLTRWQFLLLMILVYLLLGTVMEPISMMLLTVPILMPALSALDIPLIWFGVFVVFLGELAMITPPVGILTFIVHGIAQEPQVNLGQRITLGDSFQGVAWFLPTSVLMLIIIILFPELVLWLPGRM